MQRAARPRKLSGRWEPGRLVARALCALFGLIGALPLAAALLVTSEPAQRWAERETARLLASELGVSAGYEVELRLLPLRLSLENLVVPASDGGSPALVADSLTVAPRLFAMLAGRFDLGEIELIRPRARLVVQGGELKNVHYRLPAETEPRRPTERAPFSSLAITEARLDVDLDGTRVETGAIDLDVFAERGPSFEISVQADASRLSRRRIDQTLESPTTGREVADDDALCRLEARVRVEPQGIDVRRLSLLAVLDDRPAPGEAPPCAGAENHARRLSLNVSEARAARRSEAGLPPLSGRIAFRAPLSVINRFVKTLPLRGHVELSGRTRHDGSSRLPDFEGKLEGEGLGLGGYLIAQTLSADARIARDVVLLPRYEMGFADGVVKLENARIEPFAPGVPLSVEAMDQKDVPFPALMRDLDVTPNTIVAWDIHEVHARKVSGTLAPLAVEGELFGETRDFEVFDRSFRDPARKHMIGVKRAHLHGRFRVVPNALQFVDTRVQFGRTSVLAKMVSIGFDERITLIVDKGSRIDLADLSPLVTIPMAGDAELDVEMTGDMADPVLTGNLKIDRFEFGGFLIGDIKSTKAKFRPLHLELAELAAQRGSSAWVVPAARLDFDAGATLVADATFKSGAFDLRDFLAIWHFDSDPRWQDLEGETAAEARVRYVLGGPEDPCKSGVLTTSGKLSLKRLALFGERYDGGELDYRFRWFDRDAGYHGIELSTKNLLLQKGTGTLLGSLEVTRGAEISGNLVASDVPLGKLDALPSILRAATGKVSAVAELSGTLDELEATASARITPVRLGRATLAASRLSVELEPAPARLREVGKTGCGAPITAPFGSDDFARDASGGTFVVNGSLFGEAVVFDELRVTRQRNKLVRGKTRFRDLDLGAVLELVPALALSDTRVQGTLTGELEIDELRTLDPTSARASLALQGLDIERSGVSARLLPGAQPVVIADGSVRASSLSLLAATARGRATLDLSGVISHLGEKPEVAATLALRPMQLEALTQVFPRIERAKGTLTSRVTLSGPLAQPTFGGGLELKSDEILVKGMPTPFTDVDVAVALAGGELTISRGSARLGAGRLKLTGGAPVRGFDLGALRLGIKATDLSLPLGDGIRSTADADLLATWRPSANGERSLPRVTGDILLRSFEYRRPVTMTAELQSLGHRGKRTRVEAYDPSQDVVELDVTLRAARALSIRNDLVEADLLFADEGLVLAGTNGRYGLRGTVDVRRGGRITLRRSVFEVTHGTVRFDDATRLAPIVDVTAVSEYRRYADTSASGTPASATSSGSSSADSTTSVTGGRWSIRMHAHGDADDLKIDLKSDPPLAQDDIFLLITVGLTRAELDQAQSASVGESVALEALGTLSGADKAVTKAVPMIDEFRFGSSYSSRTGRTEPTVTVGKRLTDRVRANVTTGLAESREVRSNLEWRLSNRVAVESSYDNVNDISSSSLGNLGADIRWRLEFE